jgi:hypothetical protein
MRILFFVSILLFGLTSCNKGSEKSLAEVLQGDCLWDFYDKRYTNVANACFEFSANGDCFFYYYNFYNKQRTDSVYKFDHDDVVVPEKWQTVANDTLAIQGATYRVVRFTGDSVYLKVQGNDTVILSKNCKTFKEKSSAK